MTKGSHKPFLLACLLGVVLGAGGAVASVDVWGRYWDKLLRWCQGKTWSQEVKRLSAYPTEVVLTSSTAQVMTGPYPDALMAAICRGTKDDPTKEFVALFQCKADHAPTGANLFFPQMRLRVDIVPLEEAPETVRKMATADDLENLTLPVYWARSYEHSDPEFCKGGNLERAQWACCLPYGVVKSPIAVPCGETQTPIYYFGGDWSLFKPDAEERLSSTRSGTVRDAVRCMDRELKKRGIRLVVMPIPHLPSLYPDVALGRYDGRELRGEPANGATKKLLQVLKEDGVAVCDLTAYFAKHRTYSQEGREYPAWLPVDTHWSPWAGSEAARILSEEVEQDLSSGLKISRLPSEVFDVEWHRQMHTGDIGRLDSMKKLDLTVNPVPAYHPRVKSRTAEARDVLESNASTAPVHLIGDSHLYTGQDDDSGLHAHLVRNLGVPVHVTVYSGGGPREAPQMWWKANRNSQPKVVIWLFAEREATRANWFCAGRLF